MPYIKQIDRLDLFGSTKTRAAKNVGELNFVITSECLDYLIGTPKKYEDYNAIIGALECAKQEFYRRAVSVHETDKILENGDVYGSIYE